MKKATRSSQSQMANTGQSSNTGQSTSWTFLTNHAHVLIVLYQNPDMVLREVALRVGVTERAVQRIIQELEQEGYITKEKHGRQNHYVVSIDVALRHPIEAHKKIGDLLKTVVEDDPAT